MDKKLVHVTAAYPLPPNQIHYGIPFEEGYYLSLCRSKGKFPMRRYGWKEVEEEVTCKKCLIQREKQC